MNSPSARLAEISHRDSGGRDQKSSDRDRGFAPLPTSLGFSVLLCKPFLHPFAFAGVEAARGKHLARGGHPHGFALIANFRAPFPLFPRRHSGTLARSAAKSIAHPSEERVA